MYTVSTVEATVNVARNAQPCQYRNVQAGRKMSAATTMKPRSPALTVLALRSSIRLNYGAQTAFLGMPVLRCSPATYVEDRQPSIASYKFFSNSSKVSPWVAQPGMAGTSAQYPP